MRDITRRLNKAEKALRIEEPHLVDLAGFEIRSDELDELLKEISGKSRGLPINEGNGNMRAIKGKDNE